jgi:hypothetical protein
MSRSHSSNRGVSLLEGLIASVVLLTGMVGVLQGVIVASQQNSMANRHTRAAVMARELLAGFERQGRERLFVGSLAPLGNTICQSTPSAALAPYTGGLQTPPSNLAGFNGCVVDWDTLVTTRPELRALTPGYVSTAAPGEDDDLFTRVVGAYVNPSNSELAWVGVAVSWREGGRVRTVKQFSAIYDTAINQTNVEL